MKTMLAALAASVALASAAAPEKVGDLQLADKDALVAAAAKLGDMAGFPMLGAMAAQSLANPPEELAKASGKNRVALVADVTSTNSVEDILMAAEPTYETAPALPAGVVFRITVNEKGMALYSKAMKMAGKELNELSESLNGAFNAYLKMAESIKAFELSGAIGDAGLEFRFAFDAVPGGEAERLMGKSFSTRNPFDGFGPETLIASAVGAGNCGDVMKCWKKLLEVAEKNGISTKWISAAGSNGKSRFVLDLDAAATWVKSQKDSGTCPDLEKLATDLAEVCACASCQTGEAPEQAVSFEIKGMKADASPSARIARTLPEASRPGVSQMGVFSFYGIGKSVLARLCEMECCKDRLAQAKTMLPTLPPDAGCDIAYALWAEKGDGSRFAGVMRVTPAEVKGLFAAGSICVTSCLGNSAGGGAPVPVTFDDDDD